MPNLGSFIDKIDFQDVKNINVNILIFLIFGL